MKFLIELPLGGPNNPPLTVGVEVEQADDGIIDVSRSGRVVARAARSLGEMLGVIGPVAESFLDSLAGMTDIPDEIGLEFGLSLSADANLVVATTAAQANFKVTLTWRKPPAEAKETEDRPVTRQEKP